MLRFGEEGPAEEANFLTFYIEKDIRPWLPSNHKNRQTRGECKAREDDEDTAAPRRERH